MIETITPDVCGSRRRRRLALALFAAAAVAASAALGAVLGLMGGALGTPGGVLAAAALAALAGAAALRELGLVRLPVPQSRSQVPDRWRSELPLPVWSTGYGAGLGLGLLTHQPVSTFWVACAGAVVLGRPAPAAACFGFYGLGRALMVAWPGRGGRDPAAACERLSRRYRSVARANGVALAAFALALALVPIAVGAGPKKLPLGEGSQLDPSASAGALAFARRTPLLDTVVVGTAVFPGRSPALDAERLAYEDDAGVPIVRWRDRAEVARIAGATRPALEWPWLAYRTDLLDGRRELWLRHLGNGEEILLASVSPQFDIGRPSLDAGRVAWHVAGPRGSRIWLYTIRERKHRVLARTDIGLLAHPSLNGARIIWVDSRQGISFLRLWRLDKDGESTVTLARTWSRTEVFWTTALAGRTAYVTRWLVGKNLAEIDSVRF